MKKGFFTYCPKCGEKMKVWFTKSHDACRFREYRCKKCNEKIRTKEIKMFTGEQK